VTFQKQYVVLDLTAVGVIGDGFGIIQPYETNVHDVRFWSAIFLGNPQCQSGVYKACTLCK
jgi:hypothetical protein